MPPKKKKQPTDSKDGPALAGAGTPHSLRQECQIQSLAYQLRERTEVAGQALEARSAAESDRGVAMLLLAQEEAAHEATRKELTSTFLRVKESLTEKVVKLSSQIQELHDANNDTDFGINVLQKKHDAALSRKDAEIFALKAKMDDMAQEFKDMLQVVLNKMAERVVLPEPERESRGRLLQQRLADAYKSTTRQPVDFDDT